MTRLEQETTHVTAVLLAAGLSTRMGESKALLPWGHGTLLEYQIEELQTAGAAEIVVVLGAHADQLQFQLPARKHVRAVVNPDFAQGKTTSIKTGVRAASPETAHFLIIGVDQPRPRSVIQAIILHHVRSQASMTIPAYQGQRGHPLLFRADLRQELLSVHEETLGLRELVIRREREVSVFETGSPTVLVDLNTPEQYAAARAQFWPERDRV